MPLNPGTTLGPYEIVSALGSGGMGEVYRARDSRLHRDVAIKVLRESAAGLNAWDWFQREARAASALNHPHICAVYDVGESDGRPFLVMELLEGQTLQEFLGARPADAATAIHLGIQIADALEAAHAKGIIHRDIKPGNIMIAGRRQVKVLDFGLAKRASVSGMDERRTVQTLTQTGSIMGTPHYMAPEILQGHPADARSDLWALGVILYEMLSGRLPFDGESVFETASAILHERAPTLAEGVPARLRAVVERCMAKRPDERLGSAAEAREALEALRAPATNGSVDDAPRTVTGAPGSRNREANDAFALAMHFTRVQNDFARGQKQLERALELDPHFAEARRSHGLNCVIQFLNGFSNDTSLLYTAEDELRQAEAEDPTLASLPSAFAAVYLTQGRKEMIPMAALERTSAPGWAARDSLLWRAIIAMLSGENDLARDLVRQSLDRDPLFGAPRMVLGETLRMEGDGAGAIREQLRVLEQAPGNVSAIRWLTLAYLDGGALDEARALLEEKRNAFERNFLWRSAWALLLAREGKRTDALEAMDGELLTFARTVFLSSLEVAEFYAVLGDTSKAVEWIEVAVRNGDERVQWFRRSPRLAAIQDDPRFRQILQSIETRRSQSARLR